MIRSFDEDLAFSEGAAEMPFWEEVYRAAFPDFVSLAPCPRGTPAQLAGIDHWVHLADGITLHVDVKSRRDEYPDVALEIWSDRDRKKRGWMAKPLQMHFLGYGCVPKRSALLFPWQPLRAAWRAHHEEWARLADEGGVRGGDQQRQATRKTGFCWVDSPNRSYVTRSIAVPTHVLINAVRDAQVILLPRAA